MIAISHQHHALTTLVLMHLDDEHWLIKFPSNLDPKDIGAIEYLTPQQK